MTILFVSCIHANNNQNQQGYVDQLQHREKHTRKFLPDLKLNAVQLRCVEHVLAHPMPDLAAADSKGVTGKYIPAKLHFGLVYLVILMDSKSIKCNCINKTRHITT